MEKLIVSGAKKKTHVFHTIDSLFYSFTAGLVSALIFDLFPILAVPVQQMTLTDNYESRLPQSLTALGVLKCSFKFDSFTLEH